MRILLISYYFPPINTSGSMRALWTANYLSDLGHEVDVLCGLNRKDRIDPGLQDLVHITGNVHRVSVGPDGHSSSTVSKGFVSRRKTWLYASMKWLAYNLLPINFNYVPERYGRWLKQSGRYVKSWRQGRYDVVVSSFGPSSCHRIASHIVARIGALWVADYRDLWSGGDYGVLSRFWRLINRRIELSALRRADAVTTISKGLKEHLESLHHKPTYVVYNGFELIPCEPIRSPKLRILYSGTIYEGRRDPGPLFGALEMLKVKDPPITEKLEFCYCGADSGKFMNIASQYSVDDMIVDLGFVRHEVSLGLQKGADVLLLLTWNDPKEKAVLTGKLFEYLSTGNPILFIGYPLGEISEIINQTGNGVCANVPAAILAFLEAVFQGKFKCKNVGTELYTRENQTKRLHGIIAETVERRRTGTVAGSSAP